MQIQFISQGLPEGNSRPAGDAINEALRQSDYKSFAAFVAFASVDGINQLRDSFNNFTDAGGDIRESGKTKCARFEKRNVQKSGKTKRAKNFAHTTL